MKSSFSQAIKAKAFCSSILNRIVSKLNDKIKRGIKGI
jgi:hypothetical protein